MECVIITGMSGAGKSFATNVFEDIGYYCIDNMPTRLIPPFIDLFKTNTTKYEKVAFVVDIRGDSDFLQLENIIELLRDNEGVNTKILFLDSSDEVLIKRHKEKRRKHPLESYEHPLSEAVAIEREILETIKRRADYVVDTSYLATARLREHIINLFEGGNLTEAAVITVRSFGFKYGIPIDSDLVFDVRFLKNPYYVEELKHKTGLEKEVADYVFEDENTGKFVEKLKDMLTFLIPLYIKEGKTSLVISIGCTGGRHRSVAISEKIGKILSESFSNVSTYHRDIAKG